MQITLGFSPCPNDTFIFDAIVNKRIDLEGLKFEIILADVEKLNQSPCYGSFAVFHMGHLR
jgi:1,4-dihydroxy-6-naphthoate synthase